MNAPSLYEGPARDLYRAMARDGEVPLLGPGHLGVRTTGEHVDIQVDASGTVHPGAGGMSVTPDDPRDLPLHRRPESLLGTGNRPVWSIQSTRFARHLAIRQNRPEHWLIEPSILMELEAYESALADTRPHWILTHV